MGPRDYRCALCQCPLPPVPQIKLVRSAHLRLKTLHHPNILCYIDGVEVSAAALQRAVVHSTAMSSATQLVGCRE